MYARVARFEGADGEGLRRSAEQMNERAASGPPEGVPAKSFRLLIDPAAGRALAIALFDTEEEMRQGDQALNAMNPEGEGTGQRTSVEMYEVAVDVSA